MQSSFSDWVSGTDELSANSAQRQLLAIRTTARSRTHAGQRLHRQGRIWLATLVVLALGLILLPLLQNAGVRLALAANVLNLVQIFLGVSVLVCVVLVASANHALRARALLECGDRLRELAREFEKVCEDVGPGTVSSHILDEFRIRHAETLRNLESPSRNDQRLALLDMAAEHRLGRSERMRVALQAHATQIASLALPIAIVALEGVFVANALGAALWSSEPTASIASGEQLGADTSLRITR
ncbi:SLATT domain-containing protein [Niveibacterium sp. 24ML]|uniref:SLATT domain-containing protein n=1 Tax=Niveibacterium sp. 24ML TaxID=2985512 RepID=UPI00226F47F1|nr:SLATT domain-containing protein [Niveibacterium sp. 24ML]MCX9154698.1 SLATT domain-containing protein [Niveibacterium sp. 24ML]